MQGLDKLETTAVLSNLISKLASSLQVGLGMKLQIEERWEGSESDVLQTWYEY